MIGIFKLRNYQVVLTVIDDIMLLSLVDWATIFSGFATTVLVGFVAYQIRQARQELAMTQKQVNMTKQQMDSSLRPWIGAEKGLVESNGGVLLFHYQNYGQLPPKSLRLKVWASDEQLKRDELVGSEAEEWPYVGTVMPNQTKAYIMGLSGVDFNKLQSGKDKLWTCIRLDYDYADDKKGQYGVIYQFKATPQRHFSIDDEWSI